ncbi:hypothetical protein GCM10022396_00480 [Flavivirga amylovorans]
MLNKVTLEAIKDPIEGTIRLCHPNAKLSINIPKINSSINAKENKKRPELSFTFNMF